MFRFSIDYWGVQVAVEWDDEKLSPAIQSLCLPVWRDEPSLLPQAVFRIAKDSTGAYSLESPSDCPLIADRRDLVETLERRLHLYLASKTREVAFVHAGAIRWRDRAILIPGSSHSGKSTLVLEFVKAGAGYVSDEYAILDASGRVHPFPRPLRDRKPGGSRRLDASSLGWNGDSEPLEVAAVLVTNFLDRAVWNPEKLSAGQTVLEMLKHTVSAQLSPTVVMDCLSSGVKNAVRLKGARGEASEMVQKFLGTG